MNKKLGIRNGDWQKFVEIYRNEFLNPNSIIV